ncbi:MAG: CvpA family protein [Cucumibacter sp.]
MLQVFDVVAAVLVLLSALLATTRGATREVLSLASWAGAGIFAFWMFQYQSDLAKQFIADELVANIVTVGASFLVALIVLHLLTMRIADVVVDSKIGPLDRTLGFVFGAIRGVIILLVFVIFMQWLWEDVYDQMTADSRFAPTLQDWKDKLIAALPDDLEAQVNAVLEGGAPSDTDQPATPAPDEETDAPEDGAPAAESI